MASTSVTPSMQSPQNLHFSFLFSLVSKIVSFLRQPLFSSWRSHSLLLYLSIFDPWRILLNALELLWTSYVLEAGIYGWVLLFLNRALCSSSLLISMYILFLRNISSHTFLLFNIIKFGFYKGLFLELCNNAYCIGFALHTALQIMLVLLTGVLKICVFLIKKLTITFDLSRKKKKHLSLFSIGASVRIYWDKSGWQKLPSQCPCLGKNVANRNADLLCLNSFLSLKIRVVLSGD